MVRGVRAERRQPQPGGDDQLSELARHHPHERGADQEHTRSSRGNRSTKRRLSRRHARPAAQIPLRLERLGTITPSRSSVRSLAALVGAISRFARRCDLDLSWCELTTVRECDSSFAYRCHPLTKVGAKPTRTNQNRQGTTGRIAPTRI